MKRVVLLACALLLPVAARAQPISGLYVSGAAGANFAGTALSATKNTKVSTDPGPLGLLGLGWGFGNGLRVEIEGSYRSNNAQGLDTPRLDGGSLPTSDVGGRVASSAAMANLLYDIDLGRFGLSFRPYIGGGVGYGWLAYDNVGGTEPIRFSLPGNNTFNSPGRVTFNGTGGAFAYQAIAGIAFPLRFVHGLELTAEYRYFAVNSVKIAEQSVALGGNTVNGSVPSSHGSGRFDSSNNSVLIGLRYTFGTPWAR